MGRWVEAALARYLPEVEDGGEPTGAGAGRTAQGMRGGVTGLDRAGVGAEGVARGADRCAGDLAGGGKDSADRAQTGTGRGGRGEGDEWGEGRGEAATDGARWYCVLSRAT